MMQELPLFEESSSGSQGCILMLGRKVDSWQGPRPWDRELLTLIPDYLAMRYRCIPLALEGNRLTLGMADPTNVIAINDVKLVTGYEIDPVRLEGEFSELAREAWCEVLPAYDCLLTLTSLAVKAQVVGPLANVKVLQTFENPTDEHLEVVYIFPLSPRAAVHQFCMRVGQRVIEGQIAEKQEARRAYQEARQAGRRAALLEQQRDNVFTATIGNIPPGETLHLELAYAERLEMDETHTTFRFPLTVAPRYMPGQPMAASSGLGVAPDTTRVPDASKISPPLLPPDLRREGALSIEVEIQHGGVQLTSLNSTQHALETTLDEQRCLISLARVSEARNRDFVLRYRCGQGASNLLMSDGEYFLLSLTPPAQAPAEIPPRDVVLILDRSGSMQGIKMSSAKRAVAGVLRQLRHQDRFALMAFDHRMEKFRGGDLRPLSELTAALEWLGQVDADGGTEILAPVQWLMELSQRDCQRFLCAVLVTDGQVGNEPEIYAYLKAQRTRVRLFTLGVDSSVNEAFLREMARVGRGTCELVEPGAPLEQALDRLAREIGCPLSTDLEVVDAGLHPEDLLPSPLPDLYAARPVTVLGRHRGDGAMVLRGSNGLNAQLLPQTCHNPALPILWAREKIRNLQDRLDLREPLEAGWVRQEITQLGLSYGLVSPYTSFVLVDQEQVVNPKGACTTHVEPVEAPALWEVECTMKDISAQDFGPLDFEGEEEPLTTEQLQAVVEEGPIIRLVNLILSQAILDQATGIRILQESHSCRVLYEVQGEWHDVMSPPLHIMPAMVARLKQMSGLDLGLRERPQVGRIELTHDGLEWDLTVSTLPHEGAENVSLSIAEPRPEKLSSILGVDGLPQWLEAALASRCGVLHLKAPQTQGWALFARLLRHLAGQSKVAIWSSQLPPRIPQVAPFLEDHSCQVVGFCQLGEHHWELVRQKAQNLLVVVLHPDSLPLEADLGQIEWQDGWIFTASPAPEVCP